MRKINIDHYTDEWKHIEDEQPPYGENVLVITKADEYTTEEYLMGRRSLTDRYGEWFELFGRGCKGLIEIWRPLPKAKK